MREVEMKIVLASRNRHKIGELEALLRQYLPDVSLLSLDDVGFVGDIVEDGDSFEANALIKARAAAGCGYVGLGDDSGLAVDALGGAPGIYSARYAGEHGDTEANNALLLRNMEGVADRRAAFVCTVACVFPDGREICVRGESAGQILHEYHGEGGFGYDPLFYVPEWGKTFAEMSADEKNAISHRGRAVALLAERLKDEVVKC